MNKDDQDLQGYQDDLDTDPSFVDDVTHEQTDEPEDTTGVPNQLLKEDLDKIAFDELDRTSSAEKEDFREDLEDLDEDKDQR